MVPRESTQRRSDPAIRRTSFPASAVTPPFGLPAALGGQITALTPLAVRSSRAPSVAGSLFAGSHEIAGREAVTLQPFLDGALVVGEHAVDRVFSRRFPALPVHEALDHAFDAPIQLIRCQVTIKRAGPILSVF